jgi:hypothetical protein
MDVKKCGTIPLVELSAINTAERPANRFKDARRYVPWDNRIWHPRQSTMPEVNVSAANLGSRRAQQCGTVRQIGSRVLANLDRPLRRSHDGGEDAITHGVRYP